MHAGDGLGGGPAAEGPVEEGLDDPLVGDVLPAVPEALGQRAHHVLVVLHQRPVGTMAIVP